MAVGSVWQKLRAAGFAVVDFYAYQQLSCFAVYRHPECSKAFVYVIQRAFLRFQQASRPDLVIELLQYGINLYGENMEISKTDTQTYRELVSPPIFPMISENRFSKLETLIKDFRFDVNFCKSSEFGIPNFGFRIFLTTILGGSLQLVTELLKYNVATHIPVATMSSNQRHSDNMMRYTTLMSISGTVESIPYWALAFFPSELRAYLPRTCDALILATMLQSEEIMVLLLDHDFERWNTTDGLWVLRNALQLAVDEEFASGVRLLHRYVSASTVYESSGLDAAVPQRSMTAMRKSLFEACLNNDLESVKALVDAGARFEMHMTALPSPIVGSSTYFSFLHDSRGYRTDPTPHLILNNRYDMMRFLIRNYPFEESRLSEMLIRAIDTRNEDIARLILLKKNEPRAFVTDRALKRAIHNGMVNIFPMLLRELHRRDPAKLVRGYTNVVKMATKRYSDKKDPEASFLTMLKEYENSIDLLERSFQRISKRRPDTSDLSSDSSTELTTRVRKRKGKGRAANPEIRNRKSQRKAAVAAALAIEQTADPETDSDNEMTLSSQYLNSDYDTDTESNVNPVSISLIGTTTDPVNSLPRPHIVFDYDSDDMRTKFGLTSDLEDNGGSVKGPCRCAVSSPDIEMQSEYIELSDQDEDERLSMRARTLTQRRRVAGGSATIKSEPGVGEGDVESEASSSIGTSLKKRGRRL
ncbi:hypothetical protein HK096_003611 [Nowakowskiella sp. JEL0078]|nr:hypothetical protein HK096_003611 [Nowakowskiella sp. JEL0078]